MSIHVKLIDCTDGEMPCLLGHSGEDLLRALPEIAACPVAKPQSPLVGQPVDQATLVDALGWLDANCPRPEWIKIIAGIHAAPLPDDSDGRKRREIARRFSCGELDRLHCYDLECPERYTGPEAVDDAFDTLRPKAGGVTVGTIFDAARKAGWTGQVSGQSAQEIFAHYEDDKPSSDYPKPLTAHELANGNFPRAEYQVEGLLLKRHVNLLYGDGGVGKTTLSLNAAVAIAAGLALFGRETKQASVLLVLAEDGFGETKHRLEGICAQFGVSLGELPITIWCLPGSDVTLANVSDNGAITPAPFGGLLDAVLHTMPGAFVVIDSLADIATMNENLRPPVNAFLKRVLGSLCDRHAATILVSGHPSKSSMMDGTQYSGSTAFNAGVRSRLVLERPEAKSSRRILKVAKANYGSEQDVELFLMGAAFLTGADAGQAERGQAEREIVMTVALKMIDGGMRIVRGNGSGQKPKDIASQVRKLHEISVSPARVLEILNEAEREGVLRYREGKGKTIAGFVRATVA